MKTQLLKYLEEQPKARERRWKNRAIGNLLIQNYGLDIPRDKMSDIVTDVLSADRYWRMILCENPALQGKDYNTKKIVVQREQIRLGYESGYHQLNKQFQLL